MNIDPELVTDLGDGGRPTFVDGFRVSAELTETPPALSADELLRLSEEEREQLVAMLEEERLVSAQRRKLQDRIDFVRGQGASDAATLEQLGFLLAKERPLSDRRRALHREIARFRVRAA
jgi:hypothetical protein